MARRARANDAIVTLRDVTKSYGRHSVLAIDRLTLSRGERVVLMGTNGSGKSTLLRIIAGISMRDGGHIERAEALSSLRIGYVPQAGGLYGDLTVAENLRWRRRLFGSSERPVKADDYPSAYALGLRPYMTKKFAELSGGFQRLAAVAAALDMQPTWLLLDEPFSGMDDDKHERVVGLLRDSLPQLSLLVITAPVRDLFPFETRPLTLHEGRLR